VALQIMKPMTMSKHNEDRLRAAGLRPTRQRMALAEILFAKGDRHLTVEELHEEAVAAGVPVSLATVYNTLHQFTEAGLLRVLAMESTRTYFDTNISDHHHFFVEGKNEVVDIPVNNIRIDNLPTPPDDMEIAHVDVIIRLRPKAR
jgi:Fur family iron response transcriptional regulator